MATKEILSEGELDALMDSVTSGDVPLVTNGSGQSYQPFDFNTREQALLAQMPILRMINEKHSLALTQSLQALFKVPIDVEASANKLLKLEEYIVSISEPAAINQIKIKPLNGVSYVVISAELLSFFVNQYFGGAPGNTAFNSSRVELTPTEIRINELITARFLSDLEAAWSEVISLTTTVEEAAFESNPDFLQLAAPRELALQFSFVVKLFEWEGRIDWTIPYSAIEPLKSRLGGAAFDVKTKQPQSDWESYFRKELLTVNVDVSGLFSSKNVSIAEVLSLKKGSIVPLKVPTNVTLCIEDQPFCLGEHGALNGKKAIKIKKIFDYETNAN